MYNFILLGLRVYRSNKSNECSHAPHNLELTCKIFISGLNLNLPKNYFKAKSKPAKICITGGNLNLQKCVLQGEIKTCKNMFIAG